MISPNLCSVEISGQLNFLHLGILAQGFQGIGGGRDGGKDREEILYDPGLQVIYHHFPQILLIKAVIMVSLYSWEEKHTPPPDGRVSTSNFKKNT